MRVSWLANSRECLITRLIELPPYECLDIGGSIHTGQARIKNELSYSCGGLNLDL